MVAIYIAVVILAFVAVSSIVSGIVQGFLVNQRLEDQMKTVEEFSNYLSPYFEAPQVQPLNTLATELARTNGGRILMLDNNAVVQMDTASKFNGYRFPIREVRDILVDGAASSTGFHNANSNTLLGEGEWIVYYAVATNVQPQGVLLYATHIQDVIDNVRTVTQRMLPVFVGFAVAVGVISFLVSRWLTKPVLTLTNAMRRVGAQGYSERVPVKGKDEFAVMSEAFNIMSEKLENHDRLRNEFVSNASHELKTPLSTMKILAESMLYQEEFDPEMTKEFFQDINHEVDRLANIINDLLRLVQEENAERVLNLQQVDMEALVQRVINRLMPLAKEKGIRLERKLVPLKLQGDPARLEQVATNLIDNALKYTVKGSVAVTLKPDGSYGVLTVHDTGIGIPKEAVPRLFERFYRVDKARSRDTGGTGLGLSIVERIVTLHNGYIDVESVVGRGTTFTVRLPLTQPGAQEGGEA